MERIRRKIGIMMLAAAAVVLSCGSAMATDYTITDLGAALTTTGSGITYGLGASINNNGDVVGRADFPNTGNYHAAYWHNGTVSDLGVLGDPALSSQGSEAFHITDSGMIVGCASSTIPGMARAATIFSVGGSPVNIHSTMTYDAIVSGAAAANNGYIVGQAFNDSATYQHAVVWGNGTGDPSSWTTVTDKNPQGPGSTSPSAMLSINSSGQAVGWNIINPLGRRATSADPDRNQRATLWDTDGSVKYLDLSNDSGYTSINFSKADGVALDINDAGQILVRFTGFLYTNSSGNNSNGFTGIWEKDGTFTSITTQSPLFQARNNMVTLYFNSINNSGLAVGSAVGTDDATGGGIEHAIMYANGTVIDLGALFEGSGWYLTGAADINDKGQILVQANRTGFDRSGTTTLVLTPTPIPAALPLFASGLAGLGYFRRRWKA
jgi:probable HAF family extracellular repeat protein